MNTGMDVTCLSNQNVATQQQHTDSLQRYHLNNAAWCWVSVMPLLDARQIQHRTHLSVETTEAPPSAVAQIIFSAADSVGADLVVLGANRKPVSTPCHHLPQAK